MSYKQAVLKDNPIAYYPLDIKVKTYGSLLEEYSIYTDLLTNYNTYSYLEGKYPDLNPTDATGDLTGFGNNPIGLNIIEDDPIVAGHYASCRITPNNSITILNKYKAFSQDSINQTFSIEFWVSFNNLFDGQNGTYDWNINNYLSNNSLNDGSTSIIPFFVIKDTALSNTIGSIFYDKATNTIRFRIYGAGGTYVDSYCLVRDLDTQLHVYASYYNKTINININNQQGVSSTVADTSLFATSVSNVQYAIDGTSLKTNESYLFSSLAFYNYRLTEGQIKRHMLWAFNDDKPIKTSITTGNRIFSLEETQDMFAYRRIFLGKSFANATEVYNLNVTDSGLNPRKLQHGSFNQLETATLSYGANGVSWTGKKCAIDFPDFGSIVTVPGTITLVVKPSVSDEYILSIDGVNGNSTLFLERLSGVYNLKLYDLTNATTTTLATVNNPQSSDKIGISFNSSSISLNVNSTLQTSQTEISFSKNSILTIGQSYHLGKTLANLKANSSSFSYLSITDEYRTSFPTSGSVIINNYSYTGYPWQAVIKFTASLKTNLLIYQKGYWVNTFPLTSISKLVGSKVDWTRMNNCIVEYSKDYGTTWYALPRRGGHIPGYDFTGKPTTIMVRVTLITNYDVTDMHQSFGHFEIGFYSNLSMYSEDNNFLITAGSRDATYKSTYTTKLHNYQILSRPNNIGLLFTYDNITSTVPGYAQIKNLNNNTIGTIDFWMRPDKLMTGAKILTGDSSIVGYPDLSVDTDGYLIYNSAVESVYVNGIRLTGSGFQLRLNDFHHIAVVPDSYTGDLFLNGTASTTGVAGTYGFININTHSRAWQVPDRFRTFLTNKTTVLANDNSLNDLNNPLLIDSTKNYPLTYYIGS